MNAEEQILAKYERATQHIEALETVLADLRGSEKIARTDDLDQGTTTYRIVGLLEIPHSVPLILGDALHNLRSALDHLVCAMVVLSGGEVSSRNSFPVFDSLQDYKKWSDKKLEGLDRRFTSQLDAFRPYKEGTTTFGCSTA